MKLSNARSNSQHIKIIGVAGLLIAMVLVAGYSCVKEIIKFDDREITEVTVIKVLSCANATADAWGGYHASKCRVELSDGTRQTLDGPIADGDIVDKYYFRAYKENRYHTR